MCNEKRANLLRAVLVTFMFLSFGAGTASADYTLLWEDNFDGTALDTTNWTIGLRDPETGDLVPGAHGTYLLNTSYAGYNTAEDVWVSDGYLYLQNQKRTYEGTDPAGTYDYTTGWIMSMHKVYFNKGYVEMRAQFPSGDKVWPALWLIAEDLVWGPEWDMFEYFGYRSDVGYDVMGMHLCYGEYPSTSWKSNWLNDYDATYDCESWHTYGFEWTSTYAKWFIDGVEVAHEDNNIGSDWPNEQMYFVLNNGVRTDSPDTNTTWPNYVVIDYVQLYQQSGVFCGNGTCDAGEDCVSCPEDCIGKQNGPPHDRYCCGDGVCEGAEDEINCAIDCATGYCGDGTCDACEDQCGCPEDCGTPPSTETGYCSDGIDNDCDGYTDCDDSDCLGDPACPYCGDGTCDAGEDQCNCPEDCGTPPSTETGYCTDGIDNDCDGYTDCDDSDCSSDPACESSYCGDGTCDEGEDQCNCPEDCGSPPSTETNCSDGIDEDCDGYTDCDDSDCSSDPACACLPHGSACTSDSECCSGNCRNGQCRGN